MLRTLISRFSYLERFSSWYNKIKADYLMSVLRMKAIKRCSRQIKEHQRLTPPALELN